ncbi:hypothetical protein V7S43_015865 [Phytophthora oleae]|uniref:Uncharacterized protein n=1 Tax=Phytophthora oleae TaxID=2107226 RepID=A0ABD3F002_9STRA
MSDGSEIAPSGNPSRPSLVGDASGGAPASATTTSARSGGDGIVVSHGGSYSAPAPAAASSDGASGFAVTSGDPAPEGDTPSFRAPRMMSISAVDALLTRGLLTELGEHIPAVVHSDVPSNWTATTPLPDGRVFLVGVSARAADIREGSTSRTATVAPAAWSATRPFPSKTSPSWAVSSLGSLRINSCSHGPT